MSATIPLREQSHFNLPQSTHPEPVLEDRLCPGCKKSAVSEQGGLVVAFGSSFFHVDCFKCAKCRNQVTADTNLLLLSDGSPICANCSYSCNVCRQPILDEAIMAGDDSYHAHCFKCKVCKNRIDELVFAKTSQGIYCMNCHNERMIRIRKHTQKKAEREKAQGGSGSSKSRERDARNFHRENLPPTSPGHDARGQSSSSQSAAPQQQDDSRRPSNNSRVPSQTSPGLQNTAITTQGPPGMHPSAAPIFSSNVSVSVALPSTSARDLNIDHHPPVKQSTLPVPNNHPNRNARRSASYDDGLTPVEEPRNISEFGHQSASSSFNSLSVTSRQEKRRSINPGLTLNNFNHSTFSIDASPRSETSQRTATEQGRSNHQTNDNRNDKRTSHTDSIHSVQTLTSSHDVSRSPSPSIVTQYYDQQDDTVVMKPQAPEFESNPLANGSMSSNPGGPYGERLSGGLSPNDPRSNFRSQQRLSSHSNMSSGSRSASPAYRADVPHGVESGTDTEDDGGPQSLSSHRNSLPPALPPKDGRLGAKSPDSIDSQDLDGGRDDYSDAEAPQIERNSHSTYIAPALPPIRVSLTSDLSDFLNGKSISDLANLGRESVSPTPVKSAQSLSSIDEDSLSSQPPTPTAEDSSSHGHSSGSNIERPDSQSSQTSKNGFKSSKSSVISQSTVIPSSAPIPRQKKASGADIVTTRLREALENARERGANQLKLDRAFVEAILGALDSRTADLNQMKAKFDGVKRTSRQYIEGFQVAQTEYDRELKARRDAEAEVTRLRVLLSGQAARLTALNGDSKRQEVRQQLTKDLSDSLSGLENDLSRLKAERDMTLAEMEELSASKSSTPEIASATLTRSITKRLDGLRNQYKRELIPLQQQREQLNREIAELKEARDLFLEETAVLNARNEELAQLSSVYSRRMERMDSIPETPMRNGDLARNPTLPERPRATVIQGQPSLAASLSASTSSTSTTLEDGTDSRYMKVVKSEQESHTPAKNKFKWPGSKGRDMVSPTNGVEFSKSKAHIEHNFQQISLLNVITRCKHCGDKLWGSQLRCTVCSMSIHVRCIANVQIPCAQPSSAPRDDPLAPLPPSMFGRDLIEQVKADSKGGERRIPVIVEKCVDAVETLALDYEGIYRKTGGSGLQRTITQLFERGDYDSFDLQDSDRFNDICSVTSVLKTYFRSLPVPLLTFDLYDQFVAATSIRDPVSKHQTLVELINKLPVEHYYTLQKLMIHLHHVMLQCETNRMDARNLGVVFGPTLMKSRDPGAEFSDMAGKALFIQWLIEKAPEVFNESS